jgi:hypothetical protein
MTKQEEQIILKARDLVRKVCEIPEDRGVYQWEDEIVLAKQANRHTTPCTVEWSTATTRLRDPAYDLEKRFRPQDSLEALVAVLGGGSL